MRIKCDEHNDWLIEVEWEGYNAEFKKFMGGFSPRLFGYYFSPSTKYITILNVRFSMGKTVKLKKEKRMKLPLPDFLRLHEFTDKDWEGFLIGMVLFSLGLASGFIL